MKDNTKPSLHRHIWRAVFPHMNQYSRFVLPVTIAADIVQVLKPYVYIFATAKILDVLQKSQETEAVWLYAAIAVVCQMSLSILDYWLTNLHQEHLDGLNAFEKNAVTKNLFLIDYWKLEGTELEHKILQHRDELTREGGIFTKFVSLIDSACMVIFSLVVSVTALMPFIQQLFAEAGPSFAESRWFVVAMIIIVVISMLLLTVLKSKVETANIVLRDQYARHNFIFSYYRDFICNYKSGKEIRIFKQRPIIMNQVRQELLGEGVALQKRITTNTVYVSGISELISAILLLGFYLSVGMRGAIGLYSLSDAILAIGCLSQLTHNFGRVSDVLAKLKGLTQRIERYQELFVQITPETKAKSFDFPARSNWRIDVQNVSFRYGTDSRMVLKHLDMTILPGEKIAVVGENGSGKTTFIKLLCGLLHPVEGRILLDDQVISTYDSEDYYKLFSVVFQDYRLFALPLGENLSRDEKVDFDRAENVLKQVQFSSKYNLETVLYKDCDSSGVEISGGEAQKLALARALYKDAPIIILDEPTAALDPYAEFTLYEQFDSLTQGKTAIYISHRLSSCRFCDKIAVFDNGCLVQFGTHEELVQDRDSKYYSLWNAQAKYFYSDNESS